ncbi:MAG TPA: hypothetical protein VFC92_05050 [Bacteroidales bacterium]|nr:hypothetical protein [Bacteroidales bacterium]
MDRYISQLIDDIRAAAEAAPPDPLEDKSLPTWQANEIEMEAREQYINGELQPLSTILGIASNLLPDSHLLSNEHLSKLMPEMLYLLLVYNFEPDVPDGLPDRMFYDALRDIWDDDYVHVITGTVHIEFCQYDEENHCPFPGYCDECNELEDQDEDFSNLMGAVTPLDEGWPMKFDKDSVLEGIQNYCDRWCERCPFRRMCYVAITEEKMEGLLEKYPDGNIPAEEMEKWPFDEDQEDGLFNDNESQDADFDAEWSEDEGDFDTEDDDFFSPHSKAKRHPLMQQTGVFAIHMDLWLKKRDEELGDDLAHHLARGYSEAVAEAEEVLQRFHFFILIKLQRAMISFYDDENVDDGGRDMNGSAKVALLTIDESLDALTMLIRNLKSHRTELKNLRQQLEEILQMAETEFPEARAFIRPYHDQ